MKKNATKKKAAPKKSPVVKRKTTTNPKAGPVAPVQSAPEATERPTVAAAPAREYKKDTVLNLLQRENGATLDELMTSTGWQAHSVRGFISGTLRKKHGLNIERVKRNDAGTAYRQTTATGSPARLRTSGVDARD
jgi:hypothetical protein